MPIFKTIVQFWWKLIFYTANCYFWLTTTQKTSYYGNCYLLKSVTHSSVAVSGYDDFLYEKVSSQVYSPPAVHAVASTRWIREVDDSVDSSPCVVVVVSCRLHGRLLFCYILFTHSSFRWQNPNTPNTDASPPFLGRIAMRNTICRLYCYGCSVCLSLCLLVYQLVTIVRLNR